MSSLTKIEAITFDAGGTLLFPYPSVGVIYADVMARHGIVASPETLDEAFSATIRQAMQATDRSPTSSDRDWWRHVVRLTMAHLGEPDNFDAMFDDLWEEFAHPRRWRLLAGARETLRALEHRGYRLAVLSNWDQRLRPLLDRLQLASCFETMVISCEIGVEKPDPGIFEAAQTVLNLNPGRILHIGDSLRHDVQGAQAAGWQSILIDPEDKHPETSPRVRQLAELLDLLPER